MKSKYVVGIITAICLLVVYGIVVPVSSSPPFPDVTLPGLPSTGNCCLWQLHKKTLNGVRLPLAAFGPSYPCSTGSTARGKIRIRLPLTSESFDNQPCDQNPTPIPNGSVLTADGYMLARSDDFAHFLGGFTITSPAHVLLFKGTIETIDRLGTHHPPFGTELCHPLSHFEGWLVGQGTGSFVKYTLRALITADHAALPRTTQMPMAQASIDGVLIQCPMP